MPTHSLLIDRADWVAVDRAVGGDRPARLHPAELFIAVATLRSHGLTARQVADRCGVAKRTVERHNATLRDTVRAMRADGCSIAQTAAKLTIPERTVRQLWTEQDRIAAGLPARPLQLGPITHGTTAAASRHRAADEPLCEPCRLSENARGRARYWAAKKTAA